MGIPSVYVVRLTPLGNKLGSNEKTFIDVLKTMLPQSGNYTITTADKLMIRLIDDVTKEGVSDNVINALEYKGLWDIFNPKHATVFKDIRNDYSVVGFGPKVIEMVDLASEMKDQKLAELFVKKLFFVGDEEKKELDPEEVEFMKDPSNSNISRLSDHYSAEIKANDISVTQQVQVYDPVSKNFTTENVTTSFWKELQRLPEYQNKDMNSLPVIEYMIKVAKNGKVDLGYGINISVQDMLKEGKIDKRLLCTPLQNLWWFFLDHPPAFYQNFDWSPDHKTREWFLHDSDIEKLAAYAFRFTSTGGNYKSPRWNLDETIARLISPELIEVSTRYIFNFAPLNPDLDRNTLTNEQWKPLDKVFGKRAGKDVDILNYNAADIANYHATVLEKNGYDAWILFAGESGYEWAYGMYKDKGEFYTVATTGELGGPFDTPEDAVKDMCKNNAVTYGGICHVKNTEGETVSIK